MIQLKGEDKFFSDGDSGYYDLFKQVHVAIAELAVENKDYTFIIKTKWGGQWHERIRSTVYESSGIDILHEKNISLLSKGNAQSLIKQSSVVVAFNSTTILEAHLLKKNVIIPVFSEAVDKYYNTNLLFTKYFDSLVTASSKEDLKRKIIACPSEQLYMEFPNQMIKDFIGFRDGRSAARVIDGILQ